MSNGLIVWVLVSAILAPFSYAINFAYFQGEFPLTAEEKYLDHKRDSFLTSLFIAIFPYTFVALLWFCEYPKHGLKWK